MQTIFKYFIVIFLLSYCNSSKVEIERKNDTLLAKIKDHKLYLSDIPASTFVGLEKEDSLSVLKNSINEWLYEEAYFLKALENITNIHQIDKEVKEYRKSLVNTSYDKEMLKNIELTISDDDLQTFYNKHKEYFIFNEKHFEIKYVILPKNISNLAKIKKAISKEENLNLLNTYCEENPTKCHIKKASVKNKEFLVSNLKLSIYSLLVGNSYKYQYIGTDNVMIYKIVKIYKKDEIAPLKIVKKELTRLTLHNKKQEYLLELKEKTLQKAKNDKIFEKYIN